ncbi:related to BRE2 - subunit of COMPASS (Set1C) complex [Ustilago sp. UG-2017a]|nr:related to BRE2 - subunit of COMPASS (Set1C) complex [Ustilago sp. UG-2017a]
MNGLLADHDDSMAHFNGSAVPNKRKHDDLTLARDDTRSVASVLAASSPLQPSSPPPHDDRSASSTPAPPYISEAQRVYIARTAPHLLGLGQSSTPSGSPTPSAPPSGHSSPSSDDGHSTTDGLKSIPASSSKSHHIVPKNFPGPKPLTNDAEDFVPIPHLVHVPNTNALYNTVNFAFDRNGWRYTAAGPATQHLPLTVFKTLETSPANVHWCWSDRSRFTHISADASILSNEKGFRSSRTNIGVRQGEWYAEIEILPPDHLEPPPKSMVHGHQIRLGWGRREAGLNAPVGFDGYAYGYRGKTGDKVTLSRPQAYGKPYKEGDVVGMYIKLPPEREAVDKDDPANIRRERIPLRWKGQVYFESLEYPRTREMEQLFERSIKGTSLNEAYKGVEGTGVFEPYNPAANQGLGDGVDGNGNGASTSAVGGVGGSSGSAKVKNRKNPGATTKPSGPTTPSLRPIPKLEGSKIGFFLNGQPQGIAFRDLFDYRPLRVRGFTNLNPTYSSSSSTPKPARSRGKQPEPKRGEISEPIINIKPRENVFDDGALGYFPFVSSYGGARARLISGEEGFRYPPPDDIEAVLEAATPESTYSEPEGEGVGVGVKGKRWKPLCERFEDHLAEMWRYDLADEAKAQAIADQQAEEKEKKSNAAKDKYAAAKKKHAAALARDAAASPAPQMHEEERGEAEAEVDRTITREDAIEVDPTANGWDRQVNTPEPPSVEEREREGLRLPLLDGAMVEGEDVEMDDSVH